MFINNPKASGRAGPTTVRNNFHEPDNLTIPGSDNEPATIDDERNSIADRSIGFDPPASEQP
jgi:hypothetical protein